MGRISDRARESIRAFKGCRHDSCAWDLWSAKIASRAGGREEVFVMQAAQDRIGADGIRFSEAMARTRMQIVKNDDGRIGKTGTERHVRTSGVVVGNPRLQDAP